MPGSLVILTGASGAGKTTIASEMEKAFPDCTVFRFDTIGVPSTDVMATFGTPKQHPGEAWQRAMTLQWMARIAPLIKSGAHVLFEGQMRLAFLEEALGVQRVSRARVILLDCSDEVRKRRLAQDRLQPELANEEMMSWARYLRLEALRAGYEILDTGSVSLAESVARMAPYLHL